MRQFKISFIKWLATSLICIYLGFIIGNFKQDTLQQKVDLLKLDMVSLTFENTQLLKQLNFVKNELDPVEVDTEKQMYDVLLDDNKSLKKALDASNDKLYFYEQVIAPDLVLHGLTIYSFTVNKSAQDGLWSYELVLMQAKKSHHQLKGKVDIIFANTDDDVDNTKQIKLSELDTNFTSEFKFKYFQTLRGYFILPNNIEVGQIFIVAEAERNNWNRAQRVEKIYDWKAFVENDQQTLEELATQAE